MASELHTVVPSNVLSEIAPTYALFLKSFSALIVFLFSHAFLISRWILGRKGRKEVGIDASFRLIRGMICWGVSEINQSECGIRILARRGWLLSIQICDIMHEIMVKKEAISLNHEDTLVWTSPCVFLCADGCTLCLHVCQLKRKVMHHTPRCHRCHPSNRANTPATCLITCTTFTCNLSHRQTGHSINCSLH